MSAPERLIGSPAYILGEDREHGIEQGTDLEWGYPEGKSQRTKFEGSPEEIIKVFDNWVSLTGYVPEIDHINFNQESGKATLILSFGEDGYTQYELYSNTEQTPIYQHSYFTTDNPPLTVAQIVAVRNAFDEGSTISGTGKDAELLQMLNMGYETFRQTLFVLRETKIVSRRSAVRASLAGLNEVDDDMPNFSTGNPIIGAITDREWLKSDCNVKTISRTKQAIVTEWLGAVGWSKILYKGSLIP